MHTAVEVLPASGEMIDIQRSLHSIIHAYSSGGVASIGGDDRHSALSPLTPLHPPTIAGGSFTDAQQHTFKRKDQ